MRLPSTRGGMLLIGVWPGVAVTLCLGDHFFHVRTGILAYHWGPFADGQSVWVWAIFAAAAASFIALALLFRTRYVAESLPWPTLIDSAIIFVGAYALSGQIGDSHPTLLFWTLATAWLARVALRMHDRASFLGYGLALAAVGTIGEGAFSAMGLFDYHLQQVLDTPWWLAGLYLHGSIFLLESVGAARSLKP